VPDDRQTTADDEVPPPERESVRIQAALCRIGEAMGHKIWLPAADRSRVFEYWSPQWPAIEKLIQML
jgi:hypothetical protein